MQVPRNGIQVQIASEQSDVIVTTSVTGVGYNPDIYDDVKRRAIETYERALAFHYSIDVRAAQQAQEQAEQESDE